MKLFVKFVICFLIAGTAHVKAALPIEQAPIEYTNNLFQPTYGGKQITPKLLATIAQERLATVPQEVRAFINQNREILYQLTSPFFPVRDDQELRDKVNSLKEVATQLPDKNLSTYNYVFEIPSTDGARSFLLKIAGPLNKINSAWRQQFPERGIWARKPGEIAQIPYTDTYQGTSRFANELLLEKLIQNNMVETLGKKNVWLVPLTENPADEAHDGTYVVVEEKLKDIEQIAHKTDQNDANGDAVYAINKQLSQKQITDILKVIIATTLWSAPKDIVEAKNTGELFILDLEQPNQMRPGAFFNQGDADVTSKGKTPEYYNYYQVIASMGVRKFIEALADPEQFTTAKKFLEKKIQFADPIAQERLKKAIEAKEKQFKLIKESNNNNQELNEEN